MRNCGIRGTRRPLARSSSISGRLVPLMPQLRMPGSWGYVMRIHANRPMDASLPALVEFLAEEGRSTGAWQDVTPATADPMSRMP